MRYAVVYGHDLCSTFTSKPEALKNFFSIVHAYTNAQIFAVSGSNYINLTARLVHATENA